MSPTFGHVTKLFSESEFQHKGNKRTKKKMRILRQIFRYSWQEQIRKIKLFKYYTENVKKGFGQNCHQ